MPSKRPLIDVKGHLFVRPVHTGEGHYEDMLRYDIAFKRDAPPDGGSPVVMFVAYKHREHGAYLGVPTIGRWRSFGIRLDENVDASLMLEDVRRHPDLWITQAHPKPGPFAPRDYTRLVPYTFRDFLLGKEPT